MNNPLPNHLLESGWRRRLTETEQAELRAWLAAHPEAKADLEAEASLNAALAQLPDVPVPSNFTARVLQAAELEDAKAATEPSSFRLLWPWRPRWLPKAALAAFLAGFGFFSFHQVLAARRAAERAHSLAAISDISTLPSAEILTNFNIILALPPSPPSPQADVELEELLILLK